MRMQGFATLWGMGESGKHVTSFREGVNDLCEISHHSLQSQHDPRARPPLGTDIPTYAGGRQGRPEVRPRCPESPIPAGVLYGNAA